MSVSFEDAKWLRFLDTNPARIVAMFSIIGTSTTRTRFGDTPNSHPGAVNAALTASETGGSKWQRLVHAGIVEEICRGIITLRSVSQFSPDSIAAVMEDEYVSPYTAYLQILCCASDHLRLPGGPSDRRFVETVKAQWNNMMYRIWNEPGNMIRSTPAHAKERLTVSHLVTALVVLDPTFIDIIDSPQDITVSVLSRNLVHAWDEKDFVASTTALSMIFEPHPDLEFALFDYRRKGHPVPPHLFASFLQGLPDGSPQMFFTHSTRAFITMLYLQYPEALRLVSSLCRVAEFELHPHINFLQACFRSTAIFGRLFSVLKSHSRTDLLRPEVATSVVPVLQLVSICLEKIDESTDPEEGRAIMNTFCRSGIFDALENVLLLHSSITRQVPQYVSIIIRDVWKTISLFPETYPSLRRHLPRPRLLRACLDIAYSPSPAVKICLRERPETEEFICRAWCFLAAIEMSIQVDRQCMRRECRRKRVYVCKACRNVEYCSGDCQTGDWQEHRLVCGFQDELSHMDQINGINPPPQRLPFRFTSS